MSNSTCHEIEGFENLVNRILVPTEKVKTIKGGKTKIKEEKLYAGYVFVEMRLEPSATQDAALRQVLTGVTLSARWSPHIFLSDGPATYR